MAKKQVDISQFEYKDLFGRDIKVGDYIVYGAVDGRSGTLRAGQVIELTYSKTGYHEPEPKIRVKSWSNFKQDRYNPSTGKHEEGSGRQKDVTLGFLDRLIVVPESVVSEKVKSDLAGEIPAPWWKT